MHKKDFGNLGEAIVLQQAIQHDCAVFPEFGDNSKIDLVIEDKRGKLQRVQVKMASRKNGVSQLYFYKSGPNYRFAYKGTEVDWFALVDNVTGKVAWIASKCATKSGKRYSSMTLRHEQPKKKQKFSREILWFDDYTRFPFSGK